MWSPVPEVSGGGSVTKGILYPHCTMRMTQGSAPISDQPPRILIAFRLSSRVIGPKLVPVMGAPPVPSCMPVSFPSIACAWLKARPLERETGVDWVPFQACLLEISQS